MATSQTSKVLQHLRRAVLLRDGAGLTDGQLLADYLSRRDEAALATLVRRHGPMVWGVCRRVLRNYHDAEDAFQATFLVLVRKAASIASPELLANWLYGVAHQTALKARATTAKRRTRERQVTEMPEPAVTERDLWHDLQPLLDQELSRLPDMYRIAIVLCDLEGKTRKEAARQLGVPDGTLAARLARGRVMLAKRLARHGLAVSGGSLAAVLAQNVASASAPTSVVFSTIKAAGLFAAGQTAATGLISAKVAALTEGVLKTMLLTKLKIATAVLVVFAVLGAGVVGLTHQSLAANAPVPKEKKPKSDMDKLQGTWIVVSVVHGGEDMLEKMTKVAEAAKDAGTKLPKDPKEVAKDFFADSYRPITIEGDKRRHEANKQGHDEKCEGTFKIDTTQDPKEMDYTETVSSGVIRGNKGVPIAFLGIYKLEGDTLTICQRFAEYGRPAEFKSTKEGREVLRVFKRKPPAADKKDAKQPEPIRGLTALEDIQLEWQIEGSIKVVMINNVQRKLDANMKKLAVSKDEKAEQEALEAIEKNVKELRDALSLLKGKKGDK